MTRSTRRFVSCVCWLWLGIAGCAEDDGEVNAGLADSDHELAGAQVEQAIGVERRSPSSQDVMPAALRAAWIQRVQNDAGSEYVIARTQTRGLEARHPRQNLRTRFEHDGVVLTNRDGREPLRMTLARVNGREPGLGTLSHDTNKVTVARPDIDEWYVHGPMGLEQGFTIAAPLAAEGTPEGQVRLEMTIEGDYTPAMRGDAIVWTSPERTLETRELYAFDAEGQQLTASMRATPTELTIEVDVADARYPIVIDPIWTEQQKLIASDGAADDELGRSVGLSGDTAVIGSPLDDDNGTDSGSAYVFVRSGSVWTEQQKLTASDGAGDDNFGISVSVSGDTVIIGADGDDDNGSESGSAYVFVRSGSVWTEQQKLTASDGAANDRFGNSVSVSGDTAVVGAHWDDDNGGNSGSAYVFVRSGSVWSEQQKLTASDGAMNDDFGISVNQDGDTAVIGAYLDDDNGNSSGSAYVFVRSGSVWSEQQKLTASDGAGGDRFGVSVSVSGETAVIGAYLEGNGGGASGSAYAFVRSGSVWSEQQKLTASDGAGGDHFGYSVSVDGDTAVIGARFDGGSSGSAYAFVRSGSTWSEQQKLTASDGASGDRFGTSVSVSGDTVVVGARFDDDRGADSGSAYPFGFLCGNGVLDSGEECDDGAANSNSLPDACRTMCVNPSCGDNVIDTGEACDDGGTSPGDGCSATCLIEVGSGPCTDGSECEGGVCNTVAMPPVCASPIGCGNGVLDAGESCDDGNTSPGDGCNASCLREDGEACTGNAECSSGVCDTVGSNTCEPANSCGNGALETGEACDDGNVTSGDGCSATCFVDNIANGGDCSAGGNAACASGVCDTTETPDTCEPANSCGNNVLEAGEACDDGNLNSGDGCSATCFVDNQVDGSDCTTGGNAACASGVCDTNETPDTCEPANSCGNGALETGEACDDGGTSAGDSCSATCLIEVGSGPCTDGSECEGGVCNTLAMPPVCASPMSCGNGTLDAGESCDDGNTSPDDGCNASCLREDGEACTMDNECASGVCDPDASVCACDDAADCGASEVCDATEAPNACEPANACGNGAVESGEACDDGNVVPGDGCDASCLLEDGEPCTMDSECATGFCDTGESNTCEPTTCGNGTVEAGELCDDGNTTDGDGCSESCTLENAWRGGGGCAVRANTENNGRGWLVGLLFVGLVRRRRRVVSAR